MNDQEFMRQFLAVLAEAWPGGKISFELSTLEAVNPNARVQFRREGHRMVMSLKIEKDQWGRELDQCGQVQCLKCDVSINSTYSDGSKRTHCSRHD